MNQIVIFVISLFINISILNWIFSQNTQENESQYATYLSALKQIWDHHYNASVFSVYEPSYFLFGPDKPFAFNTSWKYRIIGPHRSLYTNNSGFYAGFTAEGLLDRDTDLVISRPIVDLNYMPEFFYWFDFGPSSFFNIKFGYKHISNGLGGEIAYNSRATNELYVEPMIYLFDRNLEIRTRIFIPYDLSDNVDIIDILGIFEFNLNYRHLFQFGSNKKYAIGIESNLFVRKGLNMDFTKGSVEWNISVGPFFIDKHLIPVSIISQVFAGYGETLIFYNQDYLKWRLGLQLTI